MLRWLAIAFALLATPAYAQQWIQVPICGGALPSSVNPAAATIAVNPSGQLCVLTGTISVTVPTPPAAAFPQPDSVVVTTVAGVISGSYANGAIVAEGSTSDGAATATFTSGSIITWLRGIFENTITPISVSGSFSATQTGNNIALVASQQIASPSTYGIAPVGSVLGVNAFVTNSPTVVLSGSPLSVGIAAGSSPINVTGSLSTTPASPQNTNLVQIDGQQVASPSTYGVAPVGSVQGVNAFVTSLPASPLSVGIAGPTPLNVTISGSPQNVTLTASPVSVGLPATPLNVTVGNASPTNINVVQWQGTGVASPSTYGVAPVGSVGAVNAFVTNNVNVTPPTPLQITLPASPITVAISTSPQGVAVVNNVSVTTPTPLQVTLPASPISVGIAGPTPLNVSLVAIPGSPQAVTFPASPVSVGLATPPSVNLTLPIPANVVAYTASSAFAIANAVLAIGATPGISGTHQLAKVMCGPSATATPATSFLQIFDATPHATGSDVTLGTTKPKEVIAITPSPFTQNIMTNTPPGDQFTQGITVAYTQGSQGTTPVGVTLSCTFAYN